MKNEYRFTFTRWTPQGPEENSDSVPADSLEDAMQWADGFCQRHNCRVSRIEWFDEEAGRWLNSVVSYA